MELFSQRKGIKPIKYIMQIDSMDDDLRNGLWNTLTWFYWEMANDPEHPNRTIQLSENHILDYICRHLWKDYFKNPIDTLNVSWKIAFTKRGVFFEIRDYFFNFKWNEVYDFIEFVANVSSQVCNVAHINMFFKQCNVILERESSAYHFVGGKITQITSTEEITEIEQALRLSKKLNPVSTHLKQALDLFADKKSPDYRNSIKESISAVEALCAIILNDKDVTLGKALKEIEKKTELHPALKKAFDSLYGWTSDEGGIRHALLDESELDFEDAKFMLVSCSAFVNYLTVKASKAGVTL